MQFVVLCFRLVNEAHSGEGPALVGSEAAATKPQSTQEAQVTHVPGVVAIYYPLEFRNLRLIHLA